MPTQSRRGRPRVPLTLAPPERAELESFARSRALPAGLVRRAQMLLLSADGVTNTAIAERFATSVTLVSLWRRSYRGQGLAGLYGEVRPGRPRTHDDDRIATLLKQTLETRPRDATQWTVRALAETTGISKSSVHRYPTLFGALDVAAGTVLHQCKPRHRHQEFLAFLRYLDAQVPPHLDVHLIVDNYGTHKHAKVRRWLARHPRYHLHFTPTYASWLNQI